MSKYLKLWEYIKKNNKSELTFTEVEQVLGFPLDHSFLNSKKELQEFGYEIEKISLKNNLIKINKLK